MGRQPIFIHNDGTNCRPLPGVEFTRPANCPVCGADCFYYQSADGGRVFFDSLGSPWPKHPCTSGGFEPPPLMGWDTEGYLGIEILDRIPIDKRQKLKIRFDVLKSRQRWMFIPDTVAGAKMLCRLVRNPFTIKIDGRVGRLNTFEDIGNTRQGRLIKGKVHLLPFDNS
jgi:hypothetical protein